MKTKTLESQMICKKNKEKSTTWNKFMDKNMKKSRISYKTLLSFNIRMKKVLSKQNIK